MGSCSELLIRARSWERFLEILRHDCWISLKWILNHAGGNNNNPRYLPAMPIDAGLKYAIAIKNAKPRRFIKSGFHHAQHFGLVWYFCRWFWKPGDVNTLCQVTGRLSWLVLVGWQHDQSCCLLHRTGVFSSQGRRILGRNFRNHGMTWPINISILVCEASCCKCIDWQAVCRLVLSWVLWVVERAVWFMGTSPWGGEFRLEVGMHDLDVHPRMTSCNHLLVWVIM